MKLQIFVEHGKERFADCAMDSLKRSMRWDEQAFGREYDLDIFMIVAVSDFNMGAMENKGLNVFNDKYVLASPETATDKRLCRHRVRHRAPNTSTTGRATASPAATGFSLCLKEGLTVFRDQEFSSDQRSRPVKRISDVRQLRALQFMEDAGPLCSSGATGHLSRDQQLLHADGLRERRGSDPLAQDHDRPGKFPQRHGSVFRAPRRHEAATVEQFVRCFCRCVGPNLDQFMLWYQQSGTPEVRAEASYDAAARTLTLDLAQSLRADAGPADQAADGDSARGSASSTRWATTCHSNPADGLKLRAMFWC